VDGVYNVETSYLNHTAIVAYDANKAAVAQFVAALKKGGFDVTKEPRMLPKPMP
jgi:copper chaperone CopZ